MDLTQDLPFVTPALPGTGGAIKLSPGHFVVEEIPLYEPTGEGDHVHLLVRREALTTREVQRALAREFDLAERDVGCAGQKDKIARATQSFSLPISGVPAEEVAARAAAVPGLEILRVRRHGNKLKRGHLAGNRFEILLEGTVPGARERACAILAALEECGLPNFFGEQRLGPGGRNARRGVRRLESPRASWIARMELSAWQSSLFNAWLCERIRRGWFDRLLAGDIARKTDTGGLFDVGEEGAERERHSRREISATGPIYGAHMRWAGGEPGELEREVLAASGIDPALLMRARLPGSRRPARIFLQDVSVEARSEGLHLGFRLPKGSYATIALRELTKSPG